jgi:ATP-dependent DNA ligase
LNGADLRKQTLLNRKAQLATLMAKVTDGIGVSQYIEGAADVIFENTCKLTCEGIVAKQKDLEYKRRQCQRWLAIKKTDTPAMQPVRDETF